MDENAAEFAWYQFYLDDFDAPEAVVAAAARRRQGKPSKFQRRMREAYGRTGVAWSHEKQNAGQLVVERMGALVDGQAGRISAPIEKLLHVISFGLWACTRAWVRPKVLLMVLGRFTRCFEFRRPLFGTLNDIWVRSR